jgi:hypothetical protein
MLTIMGNLDRAGFNSGTRTDVAAVAKSRGEFSRWIENQDDSVTHGTAAIGRRRAAAGDPALPRLRRLMAYGTNLLVRTIRNNRCCNRLATNASHGVFNVP